MVERSSDIHTGDNTASVGGATSFLHLMLTTLLYLCCTVIIAVSSAMNILWTGWPCYVFWCKALHPSCRNAFRIRRRCVCQNTTVFVSYLLGWRHVSATVGHPQFTKIYNDEKIYSIRTVFVHILSFQRDLVVLRLSILKLIIYSTGLVSNR